MKLLAFAEQREGKFKKAAYEVTQAGRRLADQLGAEFVTLVVGHDVAGIAQSLGGFGAQRVITVQDARLRLYSTRAYAKIVAEVAKREAAGVILFPASQMGKDLSPRVAGKLEAGIAADCIAIKVDNGEIVATRPVYAGKALIDVRVTSTTKIFTLRPNVFTATPTNGAAVSAETFTVELQDADFDARVTQVKIAEGRPDVTEASIIVSGVIEKLADVLGAAVGASRAVVDAGWRPHDEQVGQTGKTVSPTLYIACGISGAVQHLAGMSSSKYIVAINKDKDAPIFQVADYGVVGDVFEILPALTNELKRVLGK
ncbi:MAG: electron transfer flavoprotein subunit alpha/FixB family protein [Ignavibacteria bacterium]|nr:MAG: electron transfer flavoprotein subunit alpha/FixB family protein [Ignavibacteria bacterium]